MMLKRVKPFALVHQSAQISLVCFNKAVDTVEGLDCALLLLSVNWCNFVGVIRCLKQVFSLIQKT